MRTAQVERMPRYGFDNRGFMEPALSFYSHMLYNLGVLAARLQGFYHESRSHSGGGSGKLQGGGKGVEEAIASLLKMVYDMVDVLLVDSIICIEPSQNPILVTNNLFPMKVMSLCRCCFFKDFSLQVVSEETAQQIQQEVWCGNGFLKTSGFIKNS